MFQMLPITFTDSADPCSNYDSMSKPMIRVGLPRRIDNASGGSIHCAGALKLRSLALGIFTGVSGFGFFAHASMLNSFLCFFSGVLTDMVLRRRASQSLFEFASTHELEWILLLLLQDIEEAQQIFLFETTVPSC